MAHINQEEDVASRTTIDSDSSLDKGNSQILPECIIGSEEWRLDMGTLITQHQERVECILSRCEALKATITENSLQLEVIQGQLQKDIITTEGVELETQLRMDLEVARMSFRCLLVIGRQSQARVANRLTTLDLAGY